MKKQEKRNKDWNRKSNKDRSWHKDFDTKKQMKKQKKEEETEVDIMTNDCLQTSVDLSHSKQLGPSKVS